GGSGAETATCQKGARRRSPMRSRQRNAQRGRSANSLTSMTLSRRLGRPTRDPIFWAMWGCVPLSSDVSGIKLGFSIRPHRPTPNFPPTWNGAPTDLLPVVRYDPKASERSLDLLRWGLVPYWAKDLKVGVREHKRQG